MPSLYTVVSLCEAIHLPEKNLASRCILYPSGLSSPTPSGLVRMAHSVSFLVGLLVGRAEGFARLSLPAV
jgi:hypothetical protein